MAQHAPLHAQEQGAEQEPERHGNRLQVPLLADVVAERALRHVEGDGAQRPRELVGAKPHQGDEQRAEQRGPPGAPEGPFDLEQEQHADDEPVGHQVELQHAERRECEVVPGEHGNLGAAPRGGEARLGLEAGEHGRVEQEVAHGADREGRDAHRAPPETRPW